MNHELLNYIREQAAELGIHQLSLISLEDYLKRIPLYPQYTDHDDLRLAFPDTRWIISASLSWHTQWNQTPSSSEGYIARYTAANFYQELSTRLDHLARRILKKLSIHQNLSRYYRVFVNSSLFDKTIGFFSGLGRLAKNSLLSIDGIGVRGVIGTVLINADLDTPPALAPAIETACKNCSLCQKHCPTGALDQDFRINKDICIQHLSTQEEWPESINEKLFLQYWGRRFYGCTECTDICPISKKNVRMSDPSALIGYAGTLFPLTDILTMQKEDYRKRFHKNQLSARWVGEINLVRNAIASLYNLDKTHLIKEFYNKMNQLNFSASDQNFIKDFINHFLKIPVI